MDQDQADGDRVILLPDINSRELRNFIDNLYSGWSDVETQQQRMIVETEDGQPHHHRAHLSPGVSLIYDLAHDSGMLQSELFTSRNQNLVLAKLPNSGFWRYG